MFVLLAKNYFAKLASLSMMPSSTGLTTAPAAESFSAEAIIGPSAAIPVLIRAAIAVLPSAGILSATPATLATASPAAVRSGNAALADASSVIFGRAAVSLPMAPLIVSVTLRSPAMML